MLTAKHTFSLVFALATLGAARSQAAPIPVESFTKNADGVTVAMNPGVLKLQVYTSKTIRVLYTPGEELPTTKSFVITRDWQAVPFKIRQDARSITLSTASVRTVLNRATGALTFFDASGRTILAETADGGKTLTPTQVGQEQTHTVQQTFDSPPDEAIYGLGQFQDGLWNWRGLPLELRQVNTQIAVPMMVSSEGYGLLWDNASLLDFNPADQQIPLDGSLAPSTSGNQPTATEDLRKAPIDMSTLGKKTGTFTTGEAGEYVFLAKDGNRRGDFAIIVNGRQVAGVTNMWTPYALSAKVDLPAHTTITVGLRGGGGNAKLFVRPLGNATTFRSQMGEDIDYTFFYGPKFDDIIASYRQATGAAPMWPKWAYGFWQCRERYSSQQQLINTVAEFRRRQIPIDLIVQDWQYWGKFGWGAYQWDEKDYPDPRALTSALHDQNVKFMISTWHNPQGTAREELRRNNAFVKAGNGEFSEWIDVFNPVARKVRWDLLNTGFFSVGVDAWWNDATEPGDPGEGLVNQQTALGDGNRLHNAYPLFAAQGVYDGQRSATTQKRVVNLTRSAYSGMQRYGAAVWSGDVNGDWETFKRQIPAGLNFSLTGIPYWTTDAGGFFRPRDQYTSSNFNALQTRWFQWSTFCPILRIHGYQTETEMWKWLPQTQKILLAYDQLRYRMLPYNYSVAWKVTDEGYTIMRPLPMDFGEDSKTQSIGGAYMFGPSFLVAPVTQADANTWPVYLPMGTRWFNFWTGAAFSGGTTVETSAPLETLPLYVRAGSIVPLGPSLQWAAEKSADPIELRVYPGANGSFNLYEDEGDNYDYEKGAYAVIPLEWNDKSSELTIGPRKGSFAGMLSTRTFHVVWVKPNHGVGSEPTNNPDQLVTYSGRSIKIKAPKGV